MKWMRFIAIMAIILSLNGCAKSKVDQNNDLGSGDKSNSVSYTHLTLPTILLV